MKIADAARYAVGTGNANRIVTAAIPQMTAASHPCRPPDLQKQGEFPPTALSKNCCLFVSISPAIRHGGKMPHAACQIFMAFSRSSKGNLMRHPTQGMPHNDSGMSKRVCNNKGRHILWLALKTLA